MFPSKCRVVLGISLKAGLSCWKYFLSWFKDWGFRFRFFFVCTTIPFNWESCDFLAQLIQSPSAWFGVRDVYDQPLFKHSWASVTPRRERNWTMLPSISDKRSKERGITAARNAELTLTGKSCRSGVTRLCCQLLKRGRTLAISKASGNLDLIKISSKSRHPWSRNLASVLMHSPWFFHAEDKARASASGLSTGGRSQFNTNKTLQALRQSTTWASKSSQWSAHLRSRRGFKVTDPSASWCHRTSKSSKTWSSGPSFMSPQYLRYQVQKDVAQSVPTAAAPTSATAVWSTGRTWGCSRSTSLTEGTYFSTSSAGKWRATSQSSSFLQQTKLTAAVDEKHLTLTECSGCFVADAWDSMLWK